MTPVRDFLQRAGLRRPAALSGLARFRELWSLPSRAPSGRKPQSAAAPSPFPPIADYGFLSNCHTGALVAPDGAVDWLCVPSFDSAASSAVLDREAGTFRWGHSRSTFPAPGATSRGRTRWQQPGTRRRAGSWSATRSPWVRGTARTVHAPHAPSGSDDATTCCTHCALPRGKHRSRAHLRVQYSTMGECRRSGLSSKATVTSRTPQGPSRRSACGPTWPSASRETRSGLGTPLRRVSRPTARCHGQINSSHPRTSTKRTPAWPPRLASGVPGWDGRCCRTTGSGIPFNAPP